MHFQLVSCFLNIDHFQGPTKGKQGTKGQKQIFNENKETIKFYQMLSLGFTVHHFNC